LWTLRKSETLNLGASTARRAPDELKEPDLELELDDEIPQIHADGAFSADAMTNDIGRADNRDIVRPNPIPTEISFHFDPPITERMIVVDKCPVSLADSTKYYNGTKEREFKRTRSTIL
jgi:hypothetical protein